MKKQHTVLVIMMIIACTAAGLISQIDALAACRSAGILPASIAKKLLTVKPASCETLAGMMPALPGIRRSALEDGPVAVVAASSDGYVIQRDKDVAKDEPGPHKGGGPSTGYIFF